MIDSHAHVAFRQFADDREAVIERARAAGVRWVEVGTDLGQSQAAITLANQYPDEILGATVGIHPSDVMNVDDQAWADIEQLLIHDRVVAIGEVGLDYYRGGTLAQQLPLLDRFIALAVAQDKPVIFHVRDGASTNAHDDLLALLEALPSARCAQGVIHTFSGTAAQAERYLQLGLLLSFSGVVTFKNAGEIIGVAKTMPLEKMLIETDCPFLAPQPYRGQRNEPAYVQHVAEQIAVLRSVSVTDIAGATDENARRLFLGRL